ncbi:hypothetical protein FACS1894211_13830 [Clostridia bacterium]|nr:hypothetical protein FACS1894211_13830 [Clostridia bacterium]
MKNRRKCFVAAFLAGLLLSAFYLSPVTVFAKRDVPASTASGYIIDLTEHALFEEDAWEGKGFYVNSGSIANALEKDYEIRYADGTRYFVYALKVPVSANYLYQDGRYSGLDFIASYSFDYENANGYYTEKASNWEEYAYELYSAGHTNSTLELMDLLGIDDAKKTELDTLNGGLGYYMLYIKFHDRDTATAYGAQIVGRLRFSTDAQVLRDASAPAIYESVTKGFTPDIYATNDGEHLLFVRGSSTALSSGRYYRKFDGGDNGAFFGEILGDYGIYRFTFDTSKGAEYSLDALALNIAAWGQFRLSISNGAMMPSPGVNAYAARYNAAAFWDDIQCGSFGKGRATYNLDISDWIYDNGSGSCVIYLRLADATDSDGNGGSVGQINMTAYYAFSGAPVINGEDLPDGYTGLPVDLSVLSATAGIPSFPASLAFTVMDASNGPVALNASGLSFVTATAGAYSVKAVATDGNGNTAERTFAVNVLANTKTISGIEIVQLPDNTVYEYNRPINLSGGRLKINFTDSGNYTVSLLDCTADKAALSQLGAAVITVGFTFGGTTYHDSFEAVCADYVSSLAVKSIYGGKFYAGSSFDLGRFGIFAYYAGGIAAGNTADYVMLSADDPMLSVGEFAYDDTGRQTVTLYYGEVSVQVEIDFVRDYVVAVGIDTLPDKTAFDKGALIDFTGGKLLLTYKSGKTEQLNMRDNAIYFIGYDKNKSGAQTVIMMFSDFSVSFEVTVN